MSRTITTRLPSASTRLATTLGALALLPVTLPADQAAPVPPTPELTETADSQPYRLPTIIVTGEPLPATSPHSDASSVSLLTGSEARELNLTSPRDIAILAPNLTVFDANGDRLPRFSIRGLRENNFSVGESAVALYVDDVPYHDLSSRGVMLYDIAQIDFLRGPQGTLFGASRPGGVINIFTHLPDNVWEGRGGAGYGSYDQWNAEASVRGPVVQDRFYVGFSGVASQRDGFMHNPYLGTHPDTRETYAGRLALRWTPSEPWDVMFSLSGEQFNDGAVAIGPLGQPDPFKFARDFDGFVDTRALTEALRVAYRTPQFTLVSVTTHRQWSQDLMQDFDFTTNDIVRGFTYPDMRQWSQELRLQSPEDDSPWRWVGGVFFVGREREADSGSRYTGIPLPVPPFYLPGPFMDRTTADFEDHSYAAFGQLTRTLWDRLELSAGLRFDYDTRSMQRQRTDETRAIFDPAAPPIADLDLEDSFSAWQPRLAASWRVCTNGTIFASFSSAYQSGGFHQSSDDPASARFDESQSLHYEIGTRTRWFDQRLGLNLSLFLADYDDYQVYRPVNSTQFILLNADAARALGAEVELVARPWKALELGATFGLARATFEEFTDPTSGQQFDGNYINFVPEYTYGLRATYQFPYGFSARVDWQAFGRMYFDEANSIGQSPYGLLHARVGWENDRFAVAVFGRNLTDAEYYNNAINFRDPFAGADFFVGTPGDPLTVGVEASVRF